MKVISGAYVNEKKEVPFSIEIPATWGELDKNQFARIVEVLNYRKADKFTISVSLLAFIFNSKNWHILDALSDEHKTALVSCTNFLFEEKPPVKNFFPLININKKEHLAPADDLSNIGFGEWCFAHQYYIYYSITQDVEWLDKLIASIYRPQDITQNPDSADFTGDLREKFNENLIEKRSLSVANIELHLKKAILAWFTVALNEIAAVRPHVFPPAPEVDPEQPTPEPQSQPEYDGRTWLTIFRELLGPKWGTSEQLKYTNAMFILDELEDRHIAYEEAKSGN